MLNGVLDAQEQEQPSTLVLNARLLIVSPETN